MSPTNTNPNPSLNTNTNGGGSGGNRNGHVTTSSARHYVNHAVTRRPPLVAHQL
jgi:hypothetical protein